MNSKGVCGQFEEYDRIKKGAELMKQGKCYCGNTMLGERIVAGILIVNEFCSTECKTKYGERN